MDKLEKYKEITTNIVVQTGESLTKAFPKSEIICILDEKRGHFLLYEDGWEGEKRLYNCFFHIDVKSDGKVCLRIDNTDFQIGQQLINDGVAETDLELGWISPTRKKALNKIEV